MTLARAELTDWKNVTPFMDFEVNTSDTGIQQYETAFAKLLSDLADELSNGAEITLSQACSAYPQFESRLRDLWGTLIVTRAAGSFSSAMLEYDPEDSQVLPLPCDFGDYVIESEVGRGGMGVVFRATRKSDQKLVAIKMILNGEFASKAQRERFLAEGKVVAELEHPNIVPILDVGEFKDTPFICMEYVDGTTLTELIETKRPTEKEICRMAIKICDAVSYAHRLGILHRDIKPSNILVDSAGEPYLADFGLAKQLSVSQDLTRTGAILGTPAYMSPEQAAGNRNLSSTETDVYALGAVLYFMATGQPPFTGRTVVEVLMRVLEQEPPNARSINPELSTGMEQVIARCMQKSREHRYASASLLAKELDAVEHEKALSHARLAHVVGRVMRETHHASVLENWGIIWIWNSCVILFAGITTHLNYAVGFDNQRAYLVTWGAKFILWGVVFWLLRRRMGPVTFVERQLAHVWIACFTFVVVVSAMEPFLGLKPLTMAPLWAVACSMAFFVKAGMISGAFYIHAAALLLCAGAMLLVPHYAVLLFGVTLASCFLFSGWKYYRRTLSPGKTVHDLI